MREAIRIDAVQIEEDNGEAALFAWGIHDPIQFIEQAREDFHWAEALDTPAVRHLRLIRLRGGRLEEARGAPNATYLSATSPVGRRRAGVE
jgi:hypothetical protein